jgi:hypothetical protein
MQDVNVILYTTVTILQLDIFDGSIYSALRKNIWYTITMLKTEIAKLIGQVLEEKNINDVKIIVDYPADPKHGDYASNVALIAAKSLDYLLPLKLPDLGLLTLLLQLRL